MPKFTVLRRQDAYIDYTAEIEAETPEDAAWIANESSDRFRWKKQGVSEFHAALFVTLDKNGAEIAGTECGKCA